MNTVRGNSRAEWTANADGGALLYWGQGGVSA